MISSESNILANTISLHLDASARILFKKTLWKMRRDDHESVWEVWFHVLISYHYNKKHHIFFVFLDKRVRWTPWRRWWQGRRRYWCCQSTYITWTGGRNVRPFDSKRQSFLEVVAFHKSCLTILKRWKIVSHITFQVVDLLSVNTWTAMLVKRNIMHSLTVCNIKVIK